MAPEVVGVTDVPNGHEKEALVGARLATPNDLMITQSVHMCSSTRRWTPTLQCSCHLWVEAKELRKPLARCPGSVRCG